MACRPGGSGRAGLSPVTIEVVRRADQRRRWHEVGRVLFASEPRWAPPLRSYERWLVSRRNPYRRTVSLQRWLGRRGGRIVGRVAAHHAPGSDLAWFGALECDDDAEAFAALLAAAAAWAASLGAASLAGSAMYLPDDGDAGILVAGFEHPGGTARLWHPPWYAQHLAAAGFEPWGEPMPRWRLAATGAPPAATGGLAPPHAGRLADRRLVLPGISAVPDVSAVARGHRLRRAVEASVVHVDGEPAVLVPTLLGAAATAGYEAVWAPWSPDDRPPDTTHQLFASSALEMVADRN